MVQRVVRYFDKLEDHVRGYLSHYPIVYAVIGGVGIVLFWRGVWLTADYVFEFAASWVLPGTIHSADVLWWDGPLSFVIGLVIMLMTGVFVSNFIGNEIIITGLRGDKKISEKTEQDVRHEVGAIGEIRASTRKLAERLDRLAEKIEKNEGKL